jgi:hypothetical protein
VARAVDLDPREHLIVHGARRWVACVRAHEDELRELEGLFEPHFSCEAAPALAAVMRNVSIAAVREIDVRCPRCDGLSPDEARLVDAVARSQRCEREAVFELLAAWLEPAAIRLTLPAVEGLARALTTVSHRLPLREWRLPEGSSASALTAPRPRTARLH